MSTNVKQYGILERQIINLLALNGALSALEIHAHITDRHAHYSIQAIYYVLRKLKRIEVVVKVGINFSLSLTWALELLETAKQIESRLWNSLSGDQVVPSNHKSLSWSFSSLINLDDFWVQLMLLLLARSKCDFVCNFCPHPWFYYAHQSKLDKFYGILGRQKIKILLIVGGRSYLDKKFISATPRKLYQCVHGSGERYGAGIARHIMAIGDYTIKVQLGTNMGIAIDRCFSASTDTSMKQLQLLQQIINQPTRARLTVSHQPAKAKQLLHSFLRYSRGEDPAGARDV